MILESGGWLLGLQKDLDAWDTGFDLCLRWYWAILKREGVLKGCVSWVPE